jgi:molecular chaperone HtpG
MKKKNFKTESKKILDLMINSVYTNRDIFLRELISNASDAIDKLYYKSLTDDKVKLDKDEFCIKLDLDKEERIITITDNGIGMTEEELDENLGIIAKSGSSLFKEMHEKQEDINIIGQFGVGFYSAFMVAKEIRVLSKAYGANEAYLWVSDGADGYEITKAEKDECGTVITLVLKDNTDNENYDEYLEERRITGIVKKYSDYVKYPIVMREESKDEDDNKVSEDIWIENLSLKDALANLNSREKEIVTLRYFIGKTQMEVSEEIGISQAQVSRLEKNAIAEIKKAIM